MEKLLDRMKRLLSTGVDADVQFLVGQGDKQEALLPAHKPILRVASDVFDAMFRYDEKFPVSVTQNPADENAFQKEGSSPVEIPDVNVEAFKTMLSFIYADDFSGLNGNNAIDVLYAAKKYNLPLLVRECVNIPIEELNNVFIAFAKARLLEEKALRWAIEKCRQNGIECSAKNYRQMLGPALFKIRFPIIYKHFLAGIGSDWSCTCSATLCVIPQYEEKEDFNDSSKTIYQSFWPKDKDCWGFSEFMAFEKLMDPDAVWYNKEMDTVTLSTDVEFVEHSDYDYYDYYDNEDDDE
ncbi:hypothetical protein niasHT_003387 [Heterodera trifolii]|uniref:BTB domain-containing protein n=1 Tax=Heterodera trifolii TaxID=157864 RepID=A0ABD2LP42_9BILA